MTNKNLPSELQNLHKELHNELFKILDFWSSQVLDDQTNSFIGEIDHYGVPNPTANKGIIMYSRIMWTFSAACRFLKNDEYKVYADIAKNYIETYFYDTTNGGYFWEVTCDGAIVSNKKQVYAQAFVIYAYAEYYLATGDASALQKALDLFDKLEMYCYDTQFGGYFEAFSADWKKLDDVRLSSRDHNLPKGMNTNLHVLEAYSTLYEASKNEKVKQALEKEIEIFSTKILAPDNHVTIFFTEDWKPKTTEQSFGHDIESSWLLWEAAELVYEGKKLEDIKTQVMDIVKTFLAEGFDSPTNSVLYEYFPETKTYDTDRHWWVQVEAMEGLANAYQITKDITYQQYVSNIWKYINASIVDHIHGEWYWRVDADGYPVDDEPKVSMWKCPYHNGRAVMRVIQKLEKWI